MKDESLEELELELTRYRVASAAKDKRIELLKEDIAKQSAELTKLRELNKKLVEILNALQSSSSGLAKLGITNAIAAKLLKDLGV